MYTFIHKNTMKNSELTLSFLTITHKKRKYENEIINLL